MISSCKLVPFTPKPKSEFASANHIELFSKKKRRKNIEPDFKVGFYKFRVLSSVEFSELNVELNEIEKFELHYQGKNENGFVFETNFIPAKHFLNLNLGIYQLTISYINSQGILEKRRLSPLINKQSLISDDSLSYMHATVLNSQFFRLFISDLLRSNTLADVLPGRNSFSTYWFRAHICQEFMSLISQLANNNRHLLTRSGTSSSIKNYREGMDLLPEDLEWLSQNPHFVSKVSNRDYRNGQKFNIEKIKQSFIIFRKDIYENRLILFTLISMTSFYEEQLMLFQERSVLPTSSISETYNALWEYVNCLKEAFGIEKNMIEVPQPSLLFTDDPFYSQVFYWINLWFSFRDTTVGQSFIAPIPDISKVFEYYCVSHLVESLIENGFKISDQKEKNASEVNFITLSRSDNELITIHYEPIVTQDSFSEVLPLRISDKSYRHPDIVIVYKNSERQRIGVIDPKFTSSKQINNRSREIYLNYGLFFHKEDMTSIDYVASIYPNTDNIDYSENYRTGNHAEKINPYLGILSIPMDSSEMSKFYDDLRKVILDPKPNFKLDFKKYLDDTNKKGSNKASSYLRALDLLSKILVVVPSDFEDCKNIWEVNSIERLNSLYEEAKLQADIGIDSTWNVPGIPPSYLKNSFISAALASYVSFHNEKEPIAT
jgi:hypothetical protein